MSAGIKALTNVAQTFLAKARKPLQVRLKADRFLSKEPIKPRWLQELEQLEDQDEADHRDFVVRSVVDQKILTGTKERGGWDLPHMQEELLRLLMQRREVMGSLGFEPTPDLLIQLDDLFEKILRLQAEIGTQAALQAFNRRKACVPRYDVQREFPTPSTSLPVGSRTAQNASG